MAIPHRGMAPPSAARKAGLIFVGGAFALMALMHVADIHPPGRRGSAAVAPASLAALGAPAEAHDAPSPVGFADQYVQLDLSYLRWLWWPAILYLFWGMAYVCDVYFVRTIEVISERFEIPDDVAGATLMALGCNGPEMALNTIAIFHPSNIGVGAVVGGEVFNVLVIIGTAMLATPDMYLPLKLGKFNFFRDVIFYMVSVALLYHTLKDGLISRFNSVMLLCGAVCYTVVVVYSSRLANLFRTSPALRMASKRFTPKVTFSKMLVGQSLDDDDSDDDVEPEMETIQRWNDASGCADPSEGSVFSVRVEMRNRMMDRKHVSHQRYMWLREDALVVSALVNPQPGQELLKRNNSGIAYDHGGEKKNGVADHWHHGGLVNQPMFLDETGNPKEDQLSSVSQAGRPLLNEAAQKRESGAGDKCPPAYSIAGFKEAPWEIIPLEDILYCDRPTDQTHFNLHVHQHDSHLGNLITLEMFTSNVKVMDAWVIAFRQQLSNLRRQNVDAPEAKSFAEGLMEWAEWTQFPVKWFVARSIPDMDDPKLQHLYPVSFFMSMTWLAIFAWSVVKACDGIHQEFGISDDILGFTVAAAGTSFPNVFSGMCVAKQGKTSMAIANALGANVQNVFLALAVPWTIQSVFLVGGPFPMPVNNLLPAVLECAITLAPVVLIYIFNGYAMPRWSGAFYLLVYVVYVIFALGQQISKCPIWPLHCADPALVAP